MIKPSFRGRDLVNVALCASLALACVSCSSVPRSLASPQVQVAELNLLGASLNGQRFQVTLLLSNPNASAIPAERLEFQIRLAGEGYINGQSVSPLMLPGGATETLTLEVFSEQVSSASRLMALVEGPENALDYEIGGELFVNTGLREPLAFFSRGQVPLLATSSIR